MKLPAHSRYDYIPIHKRPQYEWPQGARLAVTFNNNIEYFAFGHGLGSNSAGAAAAQGQRNYAWREYGTRSASGTISTCSRSTTRRHWFSAATPDANSPRW